MIKTDHLKRDDSGMIRIVIPDSMEYPIFTQPDISIHKIWDNSAISDTLEELNRVIPLLPGGTGKESIFEVKLQERIQELMGSMMNKLIKNRFKSPGINANLMPDFEPYELSYVEITFRKTGKDEAFYIEYYLEHLSANILSLWMVCGGDDDYFDYLPSYSDVLRYLCSFFQAKEIWAKFILLLETIENADIWEEAVSPLLIDIPTT